MWRGALARQLRGRAPVRALALQSRFSVTTCPYAHSGTAGVTPTGMAQEMGSPQMERCPVVGTAPPAHCPVEHVEHSFALHTPTVWEMAGQMGKTQLSAYVAATALAGYVLAGGASPLIAAGVTAGTMLQSCSANTANQILERDYDRQMKRTCRRPLPMGHISPRAAAAISATQLVLGTGLLCSFSPAAAGIGVANWLIYVGVYTPLKRVSAVNTWCGAVVGGVPPLMGGVAVAGAVPGPVWLLASLLFFWQIPHFNGLAFHCRRDYEAAGYKMLAFYNPWRASFYAVALSALMAAITLLGPWLLDMPVEGLWYYPVTAAANGVMIYKSWLFHQAPVRHCRGCFVFSYAYLSIMLAALMLNHFQPVHTATNLVAYFDRRVEGAVE